MALQSDHEFAPTQIARAVFPTAFRGYDQDAVRRYLSRLAAALEHQQEYAGLGELEARTPAHERVDELEAEIESLQDEIKDLELELVQRSVEGVDRRDEESQAQGETGESATFDEHRAIELLGKETARVLESARSAASDILKRAETQAASLKAQAKSELAEARKRAESLVAQKQSETEELVTRLTTEAEATAQRVTAEADEHRTAVLEESSKILTEAEELAEAEQVEAEERAKQIVADAETLRQQVIAELVVERRDAQSEMDRMTAARDRLAMSLAVARSELDEVADALVASPPQSTAEQDAAQQGGSGRSGSTVDAEPAGRNNSDGAKAGEEPDIEAEVDGLIESLESSVQPQELDLGIDDDSGGEQATADAPSGKAGSKKKRQRGSKRSAGGSAAKSKSKSAESEAAATATAKAKPADPAADPGDKVSGLKVDDDSASGSGSGSSDADDRQPAADAAVAVAADDGLAADGGLDPDTGADSGEYDPVAIGDGGGSQAGTDSELDTDAQLADELNADDLGDGGEVEVISVNSGPEEGEALSLVEGFTTLDIGDDPADEGGFGNGTADDSGPRNGSRAASDGDQTAELAEVVSVPEVIDLTDEDRPVSEPQEGDDDQALVYSVLVNEPQSPDDVITTVASRTVTVQRDRTRGDLLIDEVFTGRLPKPFAARDVALTRSGPNFRRQLRRALNDDQSDVLDRLRAGRGPITVDELPGFGDQIDRYLTPLRRGLAEIAQAGARAGGQSDLSQSALDNLVRQLARYIVDMVRMPTIQALEEAPHDDRERILEPIRALYRDFRNVGLPDLTEDALYEAFAIGLYDSIEPSAPVRWIVDPRSDPDPVCEINRQRDDVAKGEVFPSGHTRPLSLPGCRCLVAVATY